MCLNDRSRAGESQISYDKNSRSVNRTIAVANREALRARVRLLQDLHTIRWEQQRHFTDVTDVYMFSSSDALTPIEGYREELVVLFG
jgi:hypothetical protein